jgi:hypothetical protein
VLTRVPERSGGAPACQERGVVFSRTSARIHVANHEAIEVQTRKAYRPYDRLVLRDRNGRIIWTVLMCERADPGWAVTAIRCKSGCRLHRRRRD